MQKHLLAFIAYFAIANTAFAVNYYVSPAGSDLNPGSFAKPWKTIAFALCGGGYGCSCSIKNLHKVGPGDTLFVRQGIYQERDIGISNTGTTQKPIVIKSFQGEKAIVDAQRTGRVFDIGMFNPSANLVIDGLQIMNGLIDGIRLGYNHMVKNVVIQNCRFSGHSFAPGENCAAIQILNSARNVVIRRCVINGDTAITNQNYCGIQIWRNDGSVQISDCEIRFTVTGIFYKHCSLGNNQTIIKNNFVHDNSGNGLWLSSNRVLVRNNLIINNGNSGIIIWEDAGGTGGSNSKIDHNTLFNNHYTLNICAGGQYNQLTNDHGARNDTVINNVLFGNNGEYGSFSIWAYAPDSFFVNNPPDEISNYNCYYNSISNSVFRLQNKFYSLPAWQATSMQDLQSVQEQPVFANISKKMDSIEDFKIIGGKAKKAAQDGSDLGADISLVLEKTK